MLETPSGGSAPGSLRESRWAQAHGSLERLEEGVLFHYARAQTLACEHFYIEHVIEPLCPEQAALWWNASIAKRQSDPRVCAFCDGYERERCRILDLLPPPKRITDLLLLLAEVREQERVGARAWRRSLEITYGTEEQEDLERGVARWEYDRHLLATELARMLLDAATSRSRRLLSPGTLHTATRPCASTRRIAR